MREEAFSRKSLDLGQMRVGVEQSTGPEYWRSLDELAGTNAFQAMVQREFPEQASELSDPVSRRNFLKLMSASLALGGLTACTVQPSEKIVPYVRAPENLIPGKPLYYATVATLGGVATGILVESHMGRPTKIEGNPQHPASLGATDAATQASILTLYDPDRAQAVTNAGRLSTWDTLLQQLNQALEAQKAKGGAGLHLLTETITSPLLGDQIDTLLTEFPQAVWHQYEPGNKDQAQSGAQLAFGEPVNTYYDLSQAEVILSLDADFLNSAPGSVRYAKQVAAGRRVRDNHHPEMNRLYVAESTPTATGSLADHRFALRPSQVEALAFALARKLGADFQAEGEVPAFEARWLEALAADLKRAKGRSAVIPGDHQSPAVHALAHAINRVLGNVGTTVFYTYPLAVKPIDQQQSMVELATAMSAGQVEVLLILGGNPVYTAPVELNFGQALRQVGLSVHLGLYEDETSQLCHWHVAESHYLEAWGDARTFDGTASIVQPLIEPLYNTKSASELMGALIGQGGRPIYDLLREYWSIQATDPDFETYWKVSLHDGLLAGTTAQPLPVTPQPLNIPAQARGPQAEGLELAYRLDANLWDGRHANNGWLQEIPRPLTRLMWDNALLVSPGTASRRGLSSRMMVDLEVQGRRLQVPVWILPGQAEETLTLHLGYGRTQAGKVGTGVGFNAYTLRTSEAPWQVAGVKVNKTFSTYELACVQDHSSMEGRHLVRSASLEEYERNPHFASEEAEHPPSDLSLYPAHEHDSVVPNAWGMVIDLNSCSGCNACMAACQAENNIPIVGKEEVLNGREMHWIRIDRYFKDDVDDPEIYHQPVPCMHCENAPCELVCPVGATVHDEEGLNEMIYNRCVGTRYCNNNCPYKVRRFNFFQYVDRDTPSLQLQRNPDVTVRSRGVMEKCTYCVQRINAARIESKKDDRPIADGEILTACQQVCPTEAITFGNIKDPGSQVAKLKANPLNYAILADLNTAPRTTYLARVKNPNPEISEG